MISVNGHDHEKIEEALSSAQNSEQPVMIACRTTIGYGAPNKGGTAGAHGAPLGKEEIKLTRKALGWDAKPFETPSQILDDWRIVGLKSCQRRKEWDKRIAAISPQIKGEFQRRCRGDLPAEFEAALVELKRKFAEELPPRHRVSLRKWCLKSLMGWLAKPLADPLI